MGIQESNKLLHWNLFLALEDDLAIISRFIELSKDNEDVYSVELSRLLFSAASEVDVVAKQLCLKFGSSKTTKGINNYRKIIVSNIPNISECIITLPRFGLTFQPWKSWANVNSENPYWWKSYNDVKHQRDKFFDKANLKNALNSVAALFILLLFYYREEAKQGLLIPNPKLLKVGEPFIVNISFYSGDGAIVYEFSNFDKAISH